MGKTAKILCIEDERMLLQDLKEELEDANYEVITAENGHAALNLLLTEKPDLIVCDVMMPKMDGPALLEHLRSKRPNLNDVPFIFLTARATRDDLLKGKRLGVDGYLTKPVDYDLLLATIEASLDQIRRIRQQSQLKLRQIYKAMQKPRATKEDLLITFVVADANSIQPITKGLTELGCIISIITEDQLSGRRISLDNVDILFLVYSKIVHYYLEHVMEGLPKDWKGFSVLLEPPQLSEEQREIIKGVGIRDTIEYPYPPVEVFKQLMKRMKART